MVSVCFYFHVHQPHRLGHYSIFDIGNHTDYFDEHKNRQIIDKVKEKCYLKTNNILYRLIKQHDGKFKVSFRSRGKVDVNKFCSAFGGGGHKVAAGCTINGSLEDVKKTVVTELKKLI